MTAVKDGSLVELADNVDGLMAYDLGSLQSGIHNEDLRAEIVATLNEFSPAARRTVVGALLRMKVDTKGCTWEDVGELATWLHEQGVRP